MIPRLSQPAQADLDEIWDRVSDESIRAADEVLDDIWAAIDRLVALPRLGHPRDDIPERLLAWRVRHWLILYEPLDGTIFVGRVVHGGRNLRSLAFPRFR